MISIMVPWRFALALAVVGGCHHGPPAPSPPEETLGIPVHVARVWATAIAPNARGGWNFIAQVYELDSGKPTEFIVLDLASGRSSVFEGPPDIYTNSNYQFSEQLRAANGRIFFPEVEGHMAYYDPADERVKQLGKVIDAPGDSIYRMTFGPDGMLYGGTQSKGLPTVFVLDPQTLAVKTLGHVGQHRVAYSYAYYLVADPPWLYVAVGQDPWELVAMNLRTGESRMLATRDGDGFMQLDARPDGVTATLISKLRTAGQRSETVSCIDGALEPRSSAVAQARARRVLAASGALQKIPEIDLSGSSPDANGTGAVRWRLNPKSAWRVASFKVKYTEPVPIESLTALPDGTLIGNARQYHGFFRYDPRRKSIQRYGEFPLSGGPRTVWNGKLYMAGYPNSALYVFDPKRPWTKDNPKYIGIFSAGAHYPYFLEPSKNGRLYYGGRRERSGVGSAVGYYAPSTSSFVGHHDRLDTLDPQGLLVLDAIDRVVLSGRIREETRNESATLVVFDRELHEIERLTVKAGLRSSGVIFATSAPGVVIGVSALDHALYRYDLMKHELLDWRDVPGLIGPSVAKDGSIWLTVDAKLVRVDDKLRWHEVRQLQQAPGTGDLFAWLGKRLYWAHGAELRAVNVSSN